jgi:hypothetical protein
MCKMSASTCPCSWRVANPSLWDMVEAGGVEPPSEKPCCAKTTCLARSDFFVARAQSGQDARATSPMISPPHYGPKRGNQPTV